jgi:hypothetical protein
MKAVVTNTDELSAADKQELESHGMSGDMKSSWEFKDVVVWGYGDGNIIIFQRKK